LYECLSIDFKGKKNKITYLLLEKLQGRTAKICIPTTKKVQKTALEVNLTIAKKTAPPETSEAVCCTFY
jgi:hypothetical protein